jgi:hypothetical protein
LSGFFVLDSLHFFDSFKPSSLKDSNPIAFPLEF